MSKHNDNMFRHVVTNGLKNQRSIGLAQGAFAMCQVVLSMAKEEDKSPEERLEKIILFCEKCINPNQAGQKEGNNA